MPRIQPRRVICWVLSISTLFAIPTCRAGAGIRAGPGPYFYDKFGRVITLRGLNVVGTSKVPDFSPFHDLGVLDSLAVFSANVARFPFIWEAYEPARGQYNETYMDYVEGVVNYLGQLGILVMIDMHQDGYARWLINGCGDGFPFWTLANSVIDGLPEPNNAGACGTWKLQYVFDTRSASAWQDFHNNHNGVRDAFLNVWHHISARFLNNSNVLGYDIINEPVGSEHRQLSPLFEDAAKVIRANDEEALLFLTPMYLLGNGGKSGLLQPTFDNYALAVHWYIQGSFTGMSTRDAFDLWFSLTESWNVPIFIGEFGVEPKPAGVGEKPAADIIEDLYEFFDEKWLSWTQWFWTNNWSNEALDGWNMENYSITDHRHNLRSNYQIRPVPQAIAGKPIKFKVDSVTKTMTLVWNVTREALVHNATTEIFAPVQGFFQAPAVEWLNLVTVAPAGSTLRCRFKEPAQNQFILCSSTGPGVHQLEIMRAPGGSSGLQRNPFLGTTKAA